METGLRDRVVLITGASGGAGPTLAETFAAEGAIVALHQRRADDTTTRAHDAASAISASGGRASVFGADLGSTDEIDAMMGRIHDELGQVSVLVTATSTYRSDRIGDLTDAVWASVLDGMLGATFRACRAVVSDMEADGWGRIVNIAARTGLTGVARGTHYAAAKAGIVGLTASLAKELGPRGILVNAIAPTQILTIKDGQPSIPEDRAEAMAKQIPLRRIATPDDLARLAVWLGSDANRYVSGEVISLTGGAQS